MLPQPAPCKACGLISSNLQRCPNCVEIKLFCPICYSAHMRDFHNQTVL